MLHFVGTVFHDTASKAKSHMEVGHDQSPNSFLIIEICERYSVRDQLGNIKELDGMLSSVEGDTYSPSAREFSIS